MGEKAPIGVPVCIKCHYELGSLMETARKGRCPECGEPWDRSEPFVLRHTTSPLRLVWNGSSIPIIGVPALLLLMWLARRAGLSSVVLSLGALGGLVVLGGAVLGPLLTYALARDEQKDTMMRARTVAALVLASLVINGLLVLIGWNVGWERFVNA